MRLIGAILLLCLSIKFGFATEDLLDIYRLAIFADPKLKQSKIAHLIMLEKKKQDVSQMLPSIDIIGSRTENWQTRTADYSQIGGSKNDVNKSNYGNYGYSITIKQPLFRYENYINYKKSINRIKLANTELIAIEQALIIRLAVQYFDVLAANDGLRFAETEKLAVEKQLAQAKNRLNAGLSAITDVYEARAQLDTTISREIVAHNKLSNSLEALREITDRKHGRLKSLVVSLNLTEPSKLDVDEWETLSISNNLDLIALRHKNKVLRLDIERQRASHYPKLDLSATYSKMIAGGGNFGSSNTENKSITLQLNIPIYRGGIVSLRIKEALYIYEKNLEKLSAGVRSIRKKVRKTYFGMMASIALLNSLKQSVASNSKAIEAIEAGNRVGIRTTVDVLNANKKLYRTKRDFARAKYDYILAGLRLKQMAGNLSVLDLVKVNSWLK